MTPRPEPPRAAGGARRRRAALAGAVALYAALCLATALVWEPAHDEGTTWDQAVAHLPLAPGEPVALERLVPAALDELTTPRLLALWRG